MAARVDADRYVITKAGQSCEILLTEISGCAAGVAINNLPHFGSLANICRWPRLEDNGDCSTATG